MESSQRLAAASMNAMLLRNNNKFGNLNLEPGCVKKEEADDYPVTGFCCGPRPQKESIQVGRTNGGSKPGCGMDVGLGFNRTAHVACFHSALNEAWERKRKGDKSVEADAYGYGRQLTYISAYACSGKLASWVDCSSAASSSTGSCDPMRRLSF